MEILGWKFSIPERKLKVEYLILRIFQFPISVDVDTN